MKKLSYLAFLIIIFLSWNTSAQDRLTIKQWYSIGEIGAVPPTTTTGNQYGIITALENPAGNMCRAQGDANCNITTVPAAGAIWEMRVRDGDGATLADVKQFTGSNTDLATNDYLLGTNAVVSMVDIGGGGPIIVYGIDTQADNITNTVNGLVVSNLNYAYDSSGTNWDRVESTAYVASVAATQTGMLVYNGNYFYDITNGTMHRWDGNLLDSDAISNTTTAPYAGTFIHAWDSVGALWQRAGLIATHADNLANSHNGLNVAGFTYFYDGATWDRARSGASGELQVTDVATRPGEDADNDWRKAKKEEVAVYVPAKTAGTAVDENDTLVLASTYILNLPNWTVWVKNVGGWSGDAFTDVWVEGSPDGTNWVSLKTAESALEQEADTLTSGNSGIAMMGSNSSIAYIRAYAVCAAGDDTTADAWITANKN